jgi:hypothetical protein
MTSIIPPRALATLTTQVGELLAQGTADPRDFTQYRDDPVGFIRDILGGSPWSKQVEIARSVLTNYKTAVRTCNSAGKSWTLAALAMWWLFARGGTVLITGSAGRTVIGQLIQGEVRRQFLKGAFPRSAELREYYIRIDGEYKLVAMVSDVPENLQGWHDPAGLLVIIDEASGVSNAALTALNSCLESPERDRIIAAGNPLPTGNFFRGLFSRDSGWHPIHISAYDCPAVTGEGPEPRVGKASAWIADQKRKGTHDPDYIARVLGEFPESLAGNALATRAQIEKAFANHADGNRRQAVADQPLTIVVDVEHVHDRTVAAIAQGLYIHELRTFPYVGGNTMAIVQELVDLVREIKDRTSLDPTDQLAAAWNNGGRFMIDATGVGKGVADRLRELGYDADDFLSGGPAPNDPVHYYNARTEAYMTLRALLQDGKASIPPSEDLLVELMNTRYEIKGSSKTLIESKDNIRDRISRSPDLADVVAMALGTAYETASIGGSVGSYGF